MKTAQNKPDVTHIDDALAELENKYNDLVWYARSPRATNVEFWRDTPEDIREGAFRAQMRVEENYPDEVAALRGEASDWQHGFNSGMLAALRFMHTARNPVLIEDDTDEPFWFGGLKDAQELFPELDT